MICEQCRGKGFVVGEPVLEDVYYGLRYIPFVSVCPNPLCHNGHVACCDGLQEQCETDRVKLNALQQEASDEDQGCVNCGGVLK